MSAERTDASPKTALIGVAAVLGTAIAGLLLVAGLTVLFNSHARPPNPAHPDAPPPPQLEVRGGADLEAVRSRGLKRLATGPVPIDRAMASVAARGWADESAPHANAPSPPGQSPSPADGARVGTGVTVPPQRAPSAVRGAASTTSPHPEPPPPPSRARSPSAGKGGPDAPGTGGAER